MAIYKTPLDLKESITDEYEYSPYDKNVKVKKAIHDAWMNYGGYEEGDNGEVNEYNINDFITKANPTDEDIKDLFNYLTEFNYHKGAKTLRDNYNSYKNGGGLTTRQSALQNELLNATDKDEWKLEQIAKYESPKGYYRDKDALKTFFGAMGIPLDKISNYRTDRNLNKGSVARELFDKYFARG